LLIKYIKDEQIRLQKRSFAEGITYHAPCNYGRKAEALFGHGYYEEARWIMDQCLEDWVEMYPKDRYEFCCGGGGGTLTTGYDDERIHYGRKKAEQIKAVGAKAIVVPCHSCHSQLNSIKGAYGLEDLRVLYLWELVADCLVV